MTLNRKQMRLGVLALVGLLVAGAVIYATNRPQWYISATTKRAVRGFDFWEEAQAVISDRSKTREVRHYQADGREVEIPGKGVVRLVAASMQVMGKPPEYFDPEGGGPVSEEVRDRLSPFDIEIPDDSPVLRLFLEGQESFYLATAFDSRTHWPVTHSYNCQFYPNDLVAVTLPLEIWHDTNLDVVIEVKGSVSSELPRYLERVWFRVDGLPGMPNSRRTKNLFEVRFKPTSLDSWSHLFAESGDVVEMNWDLPIFLQNLHTGVEDSPSPAELLELDSDGMTTPTAVLEAWHKAHPSLTLYLASPEDSWFSGRFREPWHVRLRNGLSEWWSNLW